MFEQVADRIALHLELVQSGFAGEPVARDAAVGVRQHRALRRQAIDVDRPVLLVFGQQCQRGRLVRLPLDGRRDVGPVVGHIVDEGIAVAPERGQAIGPGAILIQRAAEVGGHLPATEAARFHIELAQRLDGRTLADRVDDTARRHRAIQHGRGALQELDPFQAVGFLPAVIDVHGVKRAVAVVAALVRAKPPQEQAVRRPVDALGATHAGHIAQRVLHALGLQRFDFLRADHGDRLRRFDEGGIGLGAGGAKACRIAGERAGGGFRLGAGDGYGLQQGGVLRRRGLERVAAVRFARGAQSLAAQQFGEAFLHGVAAG